MRSTTLGLLTLCMMMSSIAGTANSETVVHVLRDGYPAEGIDIVILQSISGATVTRGRSDASGLLFLDDLEEGVLYQAQTREADRWSEDFLAGGSVDLELGYAGAVVTARLGFAGGIALSEFKSPGIDTTEQEATASPSIGILVFAPVSWSIIGEMRPFFEVNVSMSLLSADGGEDRLGNTFQLENGLRVQIGGGLSMPLRVGSYAFRLEPSIHFAPTSAEFSQKRLDGLKTNNDFVSYGIQPALRVDLPVGKLGPSKFSIDLGVGAHVPLGGSKTAEGIEAKPGIEVFGFIGVRASLSDLWRQN
jgi:hypothetical protein